MYNYPNLTGIDSDHLRNLSESMKKYFTWSIVSLSIGMVIGVASQIFMPMLLIFIEDPYGGFGGLGGFIVIMIGSFFVSLVVYVFQYRYLTIFNQVALQVHDPNLLKSAKDQRTAFILQIVTQGVAIVTLIASISFIVDLFTADPYDYYPNTSILMLMGVCMLALIGVAIANIVYKIMGFLAWDKWAQKMYYAYSQDPAIRDMKEGVEYMKWGIIASMIVGGLGTILFLVGWNKTYKMFEIFSKRPVGSPQAYQPPSQPSYQPPPQPSYQPQYSPQTQRPSGPFNGATTRAGPPPVSYGSEPPQTMMKPKFCPNCGGTVSDPNAKFCNICGRTL